jgi:hypothetical protein
MSERAGVLGSLIGALDHGVDPSRVRVVCDWVQYRNNFRDAVDVRRVLSTSGEWLLGSDGAAVADVEVAVDLRRFADGALAGNGNEVLGSVLDPSRLRRSYLEPWTAGTDGCVWDFNSLYWRHLGEWERATGRRYEQALPGGESDARNVEAARGLILDMFAVWDGLRARDALPDELYVIEIGVGDGTQATTWLDEFARLDRQRGTDYYRRLHYLMCDYSEHVLEIARKAVTDHEARVSSLILDATKPSTALKFLRHKVFLVYISNVYDNLATEEVARFGGRTYRVETRAYLAREQADAIAASIGVEPGELPAMVAKLLRLGPGLLAEAMPSSFAGVDAANAFWREAWRGVRLEERYVPLPDLDTYQIAPGVHGDVLRPMLEADGDIRVHASNGAVASFVDTLTLLHPYGRLQCHDLFVTDPHLYHTGFRGPGKYDGSIVNWVNGALLRHIGGRNGFDVSFTPFAYRPGTNVVTLTARARGRVTGGAEGSRGSPA